MGIGERVRQHRKLAGLTQMALSKRAGIRQSSLSEIERGETHSLRGDTLIQLARALQISPDYLRTGRGDPAALSAATEDESQLLAIFRSVPASAQAAIMGAATGVLRAQPEPSAADPFKHSPKRTTKRQTESR